MNSNKSVPHSVPASVRALAPVALGLLLALWFSAAPAAEPGPAPPDSLSATAPRPSGSAPVASGKWDVANPGAPLDTLRFDTTEGTWICLDLSPDGKTLALDLLGDIYTLPVAGGGATCISAGLPYEVQPRWSPDGSKILFTSDRGGGDNLWSMNPDGSDRRQLTKEDFRLLNNGIWHPSGQYVVGRKHFTSHRSLGAGEMWMYRYPEGGGGIRLTEKKNDQQDAGEPEFSPDGRFLYWSEDMSPGGHFEYNKDPNGTIYVIRSLELETGEVRDLISLPGGAVRPQASPDGKQLAFIRRIRTKSILSLYNLATGEVRELWDGLNRDQQETWSLFGVYPGYDWAPDGRSIIISAQGKIWRVDTSTGRQSEIPFRAHITQAVAQAVRFDQPVPTDTFMVRVLRWPQVTADGNTAIFQAMGYLYKRALKDGQPSGPPVRITNQTDEFEFAPAFTPDGRGLVYVTWNDRIGGRIKQVKLDGSGQRTLVTRPGHYVTAALSPDGRLLVYHRGTGDGFRGRLWEDDPGIYLLDLSTLNRKDRTGARARAESADREWGRLLTREGNHPRFSRDGQRVFLNSREGDRPALISVDLLGSGRRLHATSTRAVDFALSPDERWLAFEELWQTYVVPFPIWGRPTDVAPEMMSLPVRRLSQEGGTYLSWSADSKTVRWSLGPDLYSIPLQSLRALAGEPADTTGGKPPAVKPTPKTAMDLPDLCTARLGWEEQCDVPSTDIYLVGARILPMNDASILEDGVVHIKANRIAEVGPRSSVPIPSGARVLDVSGRTIMPGFVDVHAHFWGSNQGIYSQQNWAYLANLAFGVTTMHDPSNDTQMTYAMSEMIRTEQVLGPRIFSTGTILYGAEGDFKAVINTYDDALRAVRRTKAWGPMSVKSYNQPRRDQRQMVIKACREEHMLDIPEGASTLNHDMTMALDGHTTLEHCVPVAPLYDPELRLLSRFGTGYTPTLIVSYGGMSGENWWYQHDDVWTNERLSRFVPRSVIDPRARRRTMAPEEEYFHVQISKTAAEISRRGGNVETGAHGQLQGLGFHWEMWMLQQGGMSNLDVLRAATFNGARALGLDHEIGSIQPGKLADLLILDGDPLAEIRQSENIAYTMINGRLYDARTLEEVEPVRRPLPPGPILEMAGEAR
jgi:imidazolonepropionase-like amidohydrolase/Tol biopolymer transport system component